MIRWLRKVLGSPKPMTYEVRVALVSPTGMRWTDNERFLGRTGLTRHEADVKAQQILRDPLWEQTLVTLPEVSILDDEGWVLVTHRLPPWRRKGRCTCLSGTGLPPLHGGYRPHPPCSVHGEPSRTTPPAPPSGKGGGSR